MSDSGNATGGTEHFRIVGQMGELTVQSEPLGGKEVLEWVEAFHSRGIKNTRIRSVETNTERSGGDA